MQITTTQCSTAIETFQAIYNGIKSSDTGAQWVEDNNDRRIVLTGGVYLLLHYNDGAVGRGYYMYIRSPDDSGVQVLSYVGSGVVQVIKASSGDIYFKTLKNATAVDMDKADRFMLFKGVNSANAEQEKWCIMVNYAASAEHDTGDSAYMINRIIAPDTTTSITINGYSHNAINVSTATDERTGRAMKGSWQASCKTTVAMPLASGETAYVAKTARVLVLSPAPYYGQVQFNGKRYVSNGLWIMLDE